MSFFLKQDDYKFCMLDWNTLSNMKYKSQNKDKEQTSYFWEAVSD